VGASERPFNLSRWFGLTGLVCIAAFSAATAWVLSGFLSTSILRHDATLMREFVQHLVRAEDSAAYFAPEHIDSADDETLERHFYHLAQMPGAVRVNVYRSDLALLWSSDRRLMGRSYEPNADVREALQGRLVVSDGVVTAGESRKLEHRDFDRAERFVEIYIPVKDAGGDRVMGVVEVYKVPHTLFAAIQAGTRLIWVSAAIGGLVLYVALFGLVRRADGTIRAQRQRLLEVETLAVVGEMGTAVAHGIRNPLASIRSSAELLLASGGGGYDEAAKDIIADADRLERWVSDLLSYGRPLEAKSEALHVPALVRQLLADFAREIERRGIVSRIDMPEDLPPVRGDWILFSHALSSLVANALEAIHGPGEISVEGRLSADGRRVELRIHDTGAGMPPERLDHAFTPFHTTKAKGLGLGLSLAKRIVERLGGGIALQSRAGLGTTVRLDLPVAR
jgi:signal transduction histidine kinase